MKRLLIFFFYDDDGIVDEYVDVMLEDLKKSVDRIVVVVNGKLDSNGRRVLSRYSDTVLVRENKGLDVWAYKTAIDYIGWSKICEYDEMILMNNTICGPIYPFSEMFDEMDKRDVDFWGLTMYYNVGLPRPKNWPDNGYDIIPDHIQSHFMAMRKKMLKSYELQKYWRDIPEINTYNDSIALHESLFTARFSNAGFKYAVYVDTDDVVDYNNYGLLNNTHTVIRKKRCPIIKRKRNILETNAMLNNDFGYTVKDMFDSVKECSDYDMDLVLKNTLRTGELSAFQQGSDLDIITTEEIEASPAINKKSICIIILINDPIFYKYVGSYALKSVEGCDIVVVADDTVEKECFSEIEHSKYPPHENEGEQYKKIYEIMDEKSDDYEYFTVLCLDKKIARPFASFEVTTVRYAADSFISSKTQFCNTIDAFCKNKLLGVLVPPLNIVGANHDENIDYRSNNSETVKKYADFLGVKFKDSSTYHYPQNNIFTCRAEAVKGFMQSVKDGCKDVKEALPLNLMLPLYAQSRGFYTSRMMNDHNARSYIFQLEQTILRLGGHL